MNTHTDPVSLLSTTDAAAARLIVWLGGHDTPFGYWPTDDEQACRAAAEEWVRRDPDAIFGAADTDDGTEDDDARVERYMSAITIEAVS